MGGDRAQVVSVPLTQGGQLRKASDPLALIEMTIHRIHKHRDYSVLSNEPVYQSGIGFKAKGILWYLLTKPDGWTVNTRELEQVGPDGRDAIRAGLRELEQAGYLVRWTENGGSGQFVNRSEIFEAKADAQAWRSRFLTDDGLSGDGLSDVGLSGVGKPVAIINTDPTITDPVNTSSSSDRDRGLGEKPLKTVEPFPAFDSRRTVRRIEHVQTIPRWDINAPWTDDEERKRFDAWLRLKYATKNDPPRYAASIVGKVAKGEPSVDWEDFCTKPQAAISQSREAEVLKEWGDRQDWENFPLLADWAARCESMGWLEFGNVGGRYSAHHYFSDWWRFRGVS
jgi:hypothetical protein